MKVAPSCLTLCNPMALQPHGIQSMEFSRPEYWSGSLEAAQGAPRDPRRDSRGERSPWLPLEILIRDRRGDNTDAGGKAMYRRRQTLDSGSCNRGTPGALRSSQRGEQGHSLEVSEGVVTRECRRNSRKTTWFPPLGKMRPLPATASQGKSPVPP